MGTLVGVLSKGMSWGEERAGARKIEKVRMGKEKESKTRKRKECNLLCELVSLDGAETRCLVMRDNSYFGALKRDTRGSGVAPIVVIAPRCCCCWKKREITQKKMREREGKGRGMN